eukprot:scaffold743_cov117-Cylindrotheca_fusiformis.AAC.2
MRLPYVGMSACQSVEHVDFAVDEKGSRAGQSWTLSKGSFPPKMSADTILSAWHYCNTSSPGWGYH